MKKRKPTVIKTPFPTLEEIARILGVPLARARRIAKLAGLISLSAPKPK